MLPYLTMSSDTSPLFSASVCFHPCSLSTSLVFPLSIPLSWSVSLPPPLSLSLCSDFCSLQLAPLRSVTLPERTHIHIHTRTQLHADTPWLRLAGLFELCSIALRDCVRLCMRHVWCMFVCAHMLMGMCACLHV